MSDNHEPRARRSAEEPFDDDHVSAAPARRGTSNARRGLIAVVVALALVAGFLVVQWVRNRDLTSGGNVPVWSPSASGSSTPPPVPSAPFSTGQPSGGQASATPTSSSTPSAAAPAAGCMPAATPIKPTRFTIDDMSVNSPVLSLGTTSSGAPEAPPKNASQTVGWWNEGPKIGADKGNAILTIHTYRQGGALGNKLNSDKGLKPGMVVKLIDGQGRAMCYTYERALKVWVKDYDPNSNVLFDSKGKPQAVIVICWDINHKTDEWDSRILYYLKPMV